MAHVDVELERLTPVQREVAHRARRAAAIVAAAGLPAAYRSLAFARVLDRELDDLERADDVPAAA